MKALLLAAALLSTAAIAQAQSVSPNEVVGPNNTFRDAVFGVSLTYPAGWEVLGGTRWGKNNSENTFRFRPLWPSTAMPSLYYQPFSADNPRPTDFEAYFREQARWKEETRSRGGSNYRNVPQSYTFRTIGGRPAFSYTAVFSVGDRQMAEYFVRIAGEKLYVMFFTQGTFEEVTAITADIDRMAGSVQVP